MPEVIKEYWGVLTTAALFLVGYGDLRRKVANTHERMNQMEIRQEEYKKYMLGFDYLTMPQHDRMQANCQALWKSELIHITKTLEEIKNDIKDMRSNQR